MSDPSNNADRGSHQPVITPPVLLDMPYGLRATGQDRGPKYTPYIVVQHDDPVTPTGVFYLSPDIWVVSSRGMNLPVEGEANQIYARVHNFGRMDAANVNVYFAWADPSAAITDTSVHPIGGTDITATKKGVFISAAATFGGDSSVVVACPSPWVPGHLAHECLVVKAWCPGFDPADSPYEPVLDPVNDRHSAQHNVNVQLLAPGAQLRLGVQVANISRFAQDVVVEVRLLDFERVQATLKMLGIPVRHALSPMLQRPAIRAGLSEERAFQQGNDSAFARLLLAADAPAAPAARRHRQADCRPRGGLVTQLGERFMPWESRQVAIGATVPLDAKPGQAFGIEVTQTMGDIVIGGYAGFVVVHPD